MRKLGAILAGGRSRRFGSDKAIAMLRGKSLIDWATETCSSVVDQVVICGRSGGLADRPCPDLGPLGGLNAALHFGRSHGFDAVLSIPCDTPIVPPMIFQRLFAAAPLAYLEICPVIGLWPCLFADMLEAHLQGEDRSMRSWANRIEARAIRLDRPIDNINTIDDLQHLVTGIA